MGREYFLYMSELQEDVTSKYFPFPQGNTIIPKRVSGKKRIGKVINYRDVRFAIFLTAELV